MEPASNSPSPSDHQYFTRSKRVHRQIHYNEDSDNSDNDSTGDVDELKFRQILTELFPSTYMDKRVKATKKFKNNVLRKRQKVLNTHSARPTCNIIITKSNILEKKKLLKKKSKSHIKDETEDEVEEDSDDDYEYDEEEEDDDDYEDDDDDDYDEEEEDDDDDEEDDDEEEDDEDEEDYEQDDSEEEEAENTIIMINESPKASSKNLQQLTNKLLAQKKTKGIIENLVILANQQKHQNSPRPQRYKSSYQKHRDSPYIKSAKNNTKKDTEEQKRKQNIEKNATKFRKLLLEKDNLNDLKYFRTELDILSQDKLIDELTLINAASTVDKPYRILLLEANIPHEFKIAALKKLSIMENMDPSMGEYFKLKNWVDTFMRIPFNKVHNLPLTLSDGLDKCNTYMQSAISTLDKAVYGLDDAKMQIMQLIGQWIVNPDAGGTAVAIKGPMGTGKTTLVKEGISKILNRPFALIALGGATDSSFLEGHGYTYEGSTWGKIVDILIQTKCTNPIIYFDELDKISDTPKGEEIIGILTHLIDSTQNNNYHDKYFSEIDFDLSKALFIFSYNDESKVNPILLDRMYRISTKGYDNKEKTVIARNYLLPAIAKQIKFEEGNVMMDDATLDHIIEKYTEKEDGVRNLKRCLEIIYTKLNLYRLMSPDTSLFKDDKALKVEFPFSVTTKIVDKLIKKESEGGNDNWKRMYM